MTPTAIIGWDIGLAKEIVARITESRRSGGREFGYVEIKALVAPALKNAHNAGWDACEERVQRAAMRRKP